MKTKFKNKSGFTLVELVVVIAILAILAGVGTVTYSGYIKRTNKALDQQLVADIAYALRLEYMSNDILGTASPGEYSVILSTGTGTPRASAKGEQAMIKAFGADWQNVCKLKYDGWEGGAVTGISTDNLVASVFYDNLETTMGDVSALTEAVGEFLGGGVSVSGLNEYYTSLGYSDKAFKNLSGTEKGNIVMMFLASQTATGSQDAVVNNMFNMMKTANGVGNFDTVLGESSSVADFAGAVAMLEAAAIATNNTSALETLGNIQNVNPALPKDGKIAAIRTCLNEAYSACMSNLSTNQYIVDLLGLSYTFNADGEVDGIVGLDGEGNVAATSANFSSALANDLLGYTDAMKALNANSDTLKNYLDEESFMSSSKATSYIRYYSTTNKSGYAGEKPGENEICVMLVGEVPACSSVELGNMLK